MKKINNKIGISLCMLLVSVTLFGADWPIYKGNLYFTGNNDEIIVKNNNVKWLFQAHSAVYNPIISDGYVYFIDLKKNVYCCDEETGKLLWMVNLRAISRRFRSYSKAYGKIKYPLIKGRYLYLTDNIAVYCLNKKTGRVLWARTGRRHDRSMDNYRTWKYGRSNRYEHRRNYGLSRRRWNPRRHSYGLVDSIYANPVIHGNRIFYGTRTTFISRGLFDGHLKWQNKNIKSYSGFPSFYDKFIFTQSMDYSLNSYMLYCINAQSGKVKWQKRLPKPFKIFSPVVYKQKLYFAHSKSIYCLDLKTGDVLWSKGYGEYITSNPSFTETEILFTIGNQKIIAIKPSNGNTLHTIDLGYKASPHFVTIRDQVYVAYNYKKNFRNKKYTFTRLRAYSAFGKNTLWTFNPPFPGGTGQQSASKGIMFQPSGKYLYAIGSNYSPRKNGGGNGHFNPYDKKIPGDPDKLKKKTVKDRKIITPNDKIPLEQFVNKIKLRKMKITVKDKTSRIPLQANVEIKKWHKGKLIYSRKVRITNPGQTILVPDMNDVEITGDAPGYLPKKIIISRKDIKKKIELDRVEQGKSIIVENIFFEFDKAYLRKESLNIIDAIVKSMKYNRRIKLEIRGFTDSIGTSKYNLWLSKRRANAVRDYMIKNGISPERLQSRGYGESKPIASNKTWKGRRKNRRTEFFIIDK